MNLLFAEGGIDYLQDRGLSRKLACAVAAYKQTKIRTRVQFIDRLATRTIVQQLDLRLALDGENGANRWKHDAY